MGSACRKLAGRKANTLCLAANNSGREVLLVLCDSRISRKMHFPFGENLCRIFGRDGSSFHNLGKDVNSDCPMIFNNPADYKYVHIYVESQDGNNWDRIHSGVLNGDYITIRQGLGVYYSKRPETPPVRYHIERYRQF